MVVSAAGPIKFDAQRQRPRKRRLAVEAIGRIEL
jgi:hypothetical protein